ncbi:MAG: hypothetical protein LDLANPLL_01933 [Turneriella sp.]|nr:hypothetical protein [Turneriella sp.]
MFRKPRKLLKRLYIICVFLILCASAAIALDDTPTLTLTDTQGRYLLSKHIKILTDPSGLRTVEEILENKNTEKFIANKAKNPNFGYTDAAYWAHFSVTNKSTLKSQFYLEIAYPMLDFIDFYQVRDKKIVHHLQAGDRLPFYTREVQYHEITFPITLEPNQTNDIYLRVKSTSSLQLPLTLWSSTAYASYISQQRTFLGLYYGMMLVMVFYNFFLFISVRDKNYLYYVIFILGYLVFQFSLNGLAFQYLWPQYPAWANLAIPFSIFLGGTLANQFTRSFLQLKKNTKRLNYIFITLIFLGGLTAAVTIFLPYKIAIVAAIFYISVSTFFMITAGIVTFLKKFRPARFYIYSWAAFLAGIILYVLKTLSVLPVFFLTEYAIQLGSAIQVVLLALGLADYINTLQSERKDLILDKLESRLQMMESVSRFVPERFLEFLGKKDISDISIGEATQRDMTLMFVDIRKFTTLSENMTVEENFHFLNAYLQRMGPSIHSYRGIIDKFIGDAIMALFPDDPEDALKAAISMMQELKTYNEHRGKSNYTPLQIGIGLHFGPLMLGTVGSSDRMDTTVIGDTVNLASRIESVTKIFRTPIVLSDFVYKKLANPSLYHLREIDSVRVRGKEHPVVLYEAMDYLPPQVLSKRIEAFPSLQMGMFYYKAGSFNEAKVEFEECVKIEPNDPIPLMYIRRCDKLIRNPPSDKWSGVSRFQ